jgi:hypothetical protein
VEVEQSIELLVPAAANREKALANVKEIIKHKQATNAVMKKQAKARAAASAAMDVDSAGED